MRLLHLKTLELEEFNDGSIPPYVILSHTWEAGEEMTLVEMLLLHPSSHFAEPEAAGGISNTRRLQLWKVGLCQNQTVL